MKMIRNLLIAGLALGGAALAGLPAGEAKADGGFFFGVGTSFGHHHGRHHGWRHHRWHRHPHYSAWGYGYRPWYRAAPRTVYVLPPPQPVYVQPAPQVIVQSAPQPAPAPRMAYDTSYCREYSRTAIVNGTPVEIYGTACRQPDGQWRIVN